MGLFDLFKKKPVKKNLQEKCSDCFRPINGYVWSLDNKKYCQECYNKRMAITQQVGGRCPEEDDFEMKIEDVIFMTNQGVIVTGKIHRGVIHRNDTVTINNVTYTAMSIAAIPNEVEYAKEGTNVGLLLSTMDPGKFKRGDIVTSKRYQMATKDSNVKCNFTVEQQREWLSFLRKHIPAIMVQHYLFPSMLEQAGGMLNTIRSIAFEISKTLLSTDIDKAVNTASIDDLVTLYYILCEYSSILEEPYCNPINRKTDFILFVIKQKNPDFPA